MQVSSGVDRQLQLSVFSFSISLAVAVRQRTDRALLRVRAGLYHPGSVDRATVRAQLNIRYAQRIVAITNSVVRDAVTAW